VEDASFRLQRVEGDGHLAVKQRSELEVAGYLYGGKFSFASWSASCTAASSSASGSGRPVSHTVIGSAVWQASRCGRRSFGNSRAGATRRLITWANWARARIE